MIQACIVSALIAAAAASWGTWKVTDWKHKADEKERIEAQKETERIQRRSVDNAAQGHEADKERIRTVTRTINKEVERIVREDHFYAVDSPSCLSDDGLRQLQAAAAGTPASASKPPATVPAASSPR